MDLNKLQIDNDKAENGVSVKFGDATITIVSRNSDRFRKAVQRIFEPHQSSISLNILPDDVMKRITIAAVAEGIIVSWEGIKEGDRELEPTTENKIYVLEKYSIVRDFIDAQATNLDNFRNAQEEAEVKNS
jgi:hypothetical protein